MAQVENVDILGRFLQGFDQGIEQKQQSRLMDMRQQAFDAEQSAAAQKQAGEDRDRQLATIQQSSVLYDSAPDMIKPHIYGQIVDLAEKLGFAPQGQLPRQLTPESEPQFQKFRQSLANIGQVGLGAPTDVRSFNAMTAGLSPEDRTRAQRINLGLDPRASGAAIGYQKVTGPDGREYLVATDPRQVGAQIVGDGTSYGSGVASPGAAGGQAMGATGFDSLFAEVPGLRVTSGRRTPEENARLPNAVPNSYHLSGQAIDIGTPTPEQSAAIDQWAARNEYDVIRNYKDGHTHLEPRGRRSAGAGANPFVSRAPEDTEYAKQRAKNQADIDTYRMRAGLEAEGEAAKAAAKSRAEADAERANKVTTRSTDAQTTLSLLDEAEKILPSATSGSLERRGADAAAIFGKSTSGAQATARLNLIAAQLVAKVPRFEGPQSNTDVQFYREAAGDLANPNLPVATRMAALQTMRTLNQKYAGQSAAPAPPATGGWGIQRVR